MPLLSVITVNFRTKELIQVCLEHVWRHTHDVEYETIVVDNGSRDDSSEYLNRLANTGRIRLVERKQGLHYDARDHGEALDIAISHANGKFILLFDSDTLITDDRWWSKLTAAMVAENATAAGTVYYRNFLHPSFLLIEKAAIDRCRLSFCQQKKGFRFYDTGEQVSEVLLGHRCNLLVLPFTVSGKPILRWTPKFTRLVSENSACVDGIAHHLFYGTRWISSNCDGRISIVKNRMSQLADFIERRVTGCPVCVKHAKLNYTVLHTSRMDSLRQSSLYILLNIRFYTLGFLSKLKRTAARLCPHRL